MNSQKILICCGFLSVVFLLNSCTKTSNSDFVRIQELAQTNALDCNQEPDLSQKQYIIGYGSLMQTHSRLITLPDAKNEIPVEVSGYERGWFYLQKDLVGFTTTYLGAVLNTKSKINGIFFEFNPKHVDGIDKRERTYCRARVAKESIFPLVKNYKIPDGEYWIYLTPEPALQNPSKKYPLVQSYVDEFISGCFELQDQFQLSDFSNTCIEYTSNWSGHWINDRIYPRRPFIYQPYAYRIDKLIHKKLPNLFKKIRLQ